VSVTCALEKCPVAKDGRCLEGFNPATGCPHYGKPTSDAVGEDSAANEAMRVNYTDTHAGQALGFDDIGVFVSNTLARLITVAGPYRAGKTTLVAAVYEDLLVGVQDDYGFCWSNTIQAFEQRCHLARAVSGANTPNTGRTSGSKDEFLHLKLVSHKYGVTRDFIFSDVSGERFEKAGQSSELARTLQFLPTTSRLVLVVDGAELAKPESKFAAFREQQHFLGMAHGTDLLANLEAIDIVVTKWDQLFSEAETPAVTEFPDRALSQVRDIVGDRLRLRYWSVASRTSSDGTIKRGHGLRELVNDWLMPTSGQDLSVAELTSASHGPNRFVRHVLGDT